MPEVFEKWSGAFAKTYAFVLIEAKIAQPRDTVTECKPTMLIRNLLREVLEMIPKKDRPILKVLEDYESLWR